MGIASDRETPHEYTRFTSTKFDLPSYSVNVDGQKWTEQHFLAMEAAARRVPGGRIEFFTYQAPHADSGVRYMCVILEQSGQRVDNSQIWREFNTLCEVGSLPDPMR